MEVGSEDQLKIAVVYEDVLHSVHVWPREFGEG